MAAARKRLLLEIRDCQRNPDADITLVPDEDNIYLWAGCILGPPDSAYEGGRFQIKLVCPTNYSISPPAVAFVTPIFHPNVNFKTGEMCLDVLKSSLSPSWTLQSVCRAIIALLSDPNADSPLNCDAGNLLRCGDVRGFRSMAQMYTHEYAIGVATSSSTPLSNEEGVN